VNVVSTSLASDGSFEGLPSCLSVEAAVGFLGISKSTGYERIKDGTLLALRLGGRLVIARYALFGSIFHPGSQSAAACKGVVAAPRNSVTRAGYCRQRELDR